MAKAEQNTNSVIVRLPYGLSLRVPAGWRASDPIVSNSLQSGVAPVIAAHLAENANGSLITFAPPIGSRVEASLVVLVLPAALSQERLAAMSESDIWAAEASRFRPEVEEVVAELGQTLTEWRPLRRTVLGGRHALLVSYLYSDSGKRMSKQSYYVYLGSKSIQAHVYQPAVPPDSIADALKAMIASIAIAVDRL